MSNSLFLVCHETRQCVHVAENSASWFRGANDSLIVGAFCEAHWEKQVVLMGAQGVDDADDTNGLNPYEDWTPSNFEPLLRKVLGEGDQSDELIRKIKESLAEYIQLEFARLGGMK